LTTWAAREFPARKVIWLVGVSASKQRNHGGGRKKKWNTALRQVAFRRDHETHRPTPDGKPQADIAIPSFGYKSSISICRRFGFIRKGKVTDGARFDGRMLRDVVTNDNTASDVWADTAYRSQANERWLRRNGKVSRIHRKKPRGKLMPERTAQANAAKSKVRARVEHVFAHQKDKMGLFIRTIGIKRAEAKVTLANLAYNMHRLVYHERRAAIA